MVKVTIKNFKQEAFEVEIDESKTVSELKTALEEKTNREMSAENQTLIYSGVVMENDQILKHYKIDEKKFLVVMMRKPTKANDDGNSSSSSDRNEKATPGKSTNPEQGTSKPQNYVTSDSVSDPTDIEKAIQNIMEMGYPKDDVVRALRASFNNPDRAVEYLVNGIPEEFLLDAPDTGDTIASTNVEATESGSNSQSPLSFLRNNPRFQQMKVLLRQNPEMLNSLILQIGETNPGLLHLITVNQDEFVELLNEPPEQPDTTTGNDGGLYDQLPRDTPVVTVTPQDREAIDRLKALGFPEELVIQAYFACDKNEQQAANFLLSQNDDV